MFIVARVGSRKKYFLAHAIQPILPVVPGMGSRMGSRLPDLDSEIRVGFVGGQVSCNGFQC